MNADLVLYLFGIYCCAVCIVGLFMLGVGDELEDQIISAGVLAARWRGYCVFICCVYAFDEDGLMRFFQPDNLHNYTHYIDGSVALPDHMYIGKPCKNGHTSKGKSVRYKKGLHCICCANHTTQNSLAKKGKAHRDAMKAYELMHECDDLGEDLF